MGSSPLARGTRQWPVCGRPERGLIPARAGNTQFFPLNHMPRPGLIPARAGNTPARPPVAHRYGAHPRSRGEHTSKCWRRRNRRGSSPLARGTPCWRMDQRTNPGLIPARAGNTSRHGYSANGNGAHPRSRGEHLKRLPVCRLMRGSSPLARGTRERKAVDGQMSGLIPARAGNTRGFPQGC